MSRWIDETLGEVFAACLEAARHQGRPVQLEVSNIHNPAREIVDSLTAPEPYEGLVIYIAAATP